MTSTASKYFDNKTLFVTSLAANEAQVEAALKGALKRAVTILGGFDCYYRINVVTLRDDQLVGYTYIRVTNPAIYHLLCGRNPDGTERVEVIPDPDWVPPETSEPDYSHDAESNWADLMDEEDSQERPMIKKKLPPLLTLGTYRLTEEQKRIYPDLITSIAKHNNTYTPDMKIVVPDEEELACSGAFVTDVEDKYVPNVICARGAPTWLTEAFVKKYFEPYASDTTSKASRFVAGRSIKDTYPFVTINSSGMVFVTFDPRTRDAQFCIHMKRKAVMIDPSNKNNKVILFFNHSYRPSK